MLLARSALCLEPVRKTSGIRDLLWRGRGGRGSHGSGRRRLRLEKVRKHSMRRNIHFTELFHRYESNPILTASDWPYRANSVFNSGATMLASGETLLLVRVEDRRGISHLTAARSKDGLTNWAIDSKPTFAPDPENYPEEIWGVEDPRITWMEELEQY